jgi:hypothetical protein
MRRTAILGTFLAAAVVGGTMTASVAAAAPPEFSPPFPNAFASSSKAMKLQTVGGFKVTCKADRNTGEVTGPTSAVITITFIGCASARASCQNASAPGVIVTTPLSGTLGYVSRVPKVVGLDLSSPPGGPLVSFVCGEDLSVQVFGSVIGRIAPINKTIAPGEHLKLTFAQKEGHQQIKMLLGGPLDVPMTSVLGGPPQESGIASTDLLTFAAPITVIV